MRKNEVTLWDQRDSWIPPHCKTFGQDQHCSLISHVCGALWWQQAAVTLTRTSDYKHLDYEIKKEVKWESSVQFWKETHWCLTRLVSLVVCGPLWPVVRKRAGTHSTSPPMSTLISAPLESLPGLLATCLCMRFTCLSVFAQFYCSVYLCFNTVTDAVTSGSHRKADVDMKYIQYIKYF